MHLILDKIMIQPHFDDMIMYLIIEIMKSFELCFKLSENGNIDVLYMHVKCKKVIIGEF